MITAMWVSIGLMGVSLAAMLISSYKKDQYIKHLHGKNAKLLTTSNDLLKANEDMALDLIDSNKDLLLKTIEGNPEILFRDDGLIKEFLKSNRLVHRWELTGRRKMSTINGLGFDHIIKECSVCGMIKEYNIGTHNVRGIPEGYFFAGKGVEYDGIGEPPCIGQIRTLDADT